MNFSEPSLSKRIACSVIHFGPCRHSRSGSRRGGAGHRRCRRRRREGDVYPREGGGLRPGHQQQEQRGDPRRHLLPQGLAEGRAMRRGQPHALRDMREKQGLLQAVRQDHRRQRRGRGQAAGGHHQARPGHRCTRPGAHRRRQGPRAGAQSQGRRRRAQPHHRHPGRPRPHGPLPQGGPPQGRLRPPRPGHRGHRHRADQGQLRGEHGERRRGLPGGGGGGHQLRGPLR